MTLWVIGMIALRILVLAVVVLGIYKLVSFLRQRERERQAVEAKAERRALIIARERYASGEINEEEYGHKLKVLGAR